MTALPFDTSTRGPRVGLIGLGLILGLTLWRAEPQRGRGAGAPPDAFSSERALHALERVLGRGEPHPLGSAANGLVRDRLVAELRGLGLETEVHQGFACSSWGACGAVSNVVALRRGEDETRRVLLMAHYDSVAAGPGAGDDGAGVATLLEVGRALAHEPARRHGVVLLFTDGEEAGLLGAHAFVDADPLFERIGVVVNVEARGQAGPSLLFEYSGEQNGWLVEHAARALPRPLTSSLLATIYDRLPNDTDLTPFKRRGVPGLNLAVIGEPRRYHSARDELVRLNEGSVQQHGDNTLALARALANDSLASRGGRVAFADVLGFFVLRWPEAWSLRLAGGALAWVLFLSLLGLRRGRGHGRGLLFGALGLLVASLTAALFQVGLLQAWRVLAPGGRHWLASGGPVIAAAWGCGVFGAALGALVARRHGSVSGRVHGTWLVWIVGALLLAVNLPGAAPVLLVPAVVAAGASLVPRLALLLPTFAAALMLLPVAYFLYDAMGLPLTPATAFVVAVVAYGLAPRVGPHARPHRLLGWPLGLTIGAALVAAWLPVDRPDRPQAMNVLHVEEDGRARVRVVAESGRLPAGLRAAAPFAPEQELALPWTPDLKAFGAPVAAAGFEPPSAEVIEDRRDGVARVVTLRIASRRGAQVLEVVVPSELSASVRLDGRLVPAPQDARERRATTTWRAIAHVTVPPAGVVVELRLPQARPFELIVSDRSNDLPAATRAIADHRPADAAPIGTGDVTLVLRRLAL